MDGDAISYEQATGAVPFAPEPPAAPSDATSDDASSYAGRELTVRPRRADAAPPPPATAPIDAATGDGTKPSDIPSGWISYEEASTPPTPHPGGVLSNTADDGWLSGAAKGLGTAAVKAVGDIAGAPTGLHNFVDYILARAEAKVTGKEQVMPSRIVRSERRKLRRDE